MDKTLFEKVDAYISGLLAPEDAALQSALKSLEANGIPNISISASQGKLLQVLAKTCQAKRILELGTLVGYSTIWLARALPEDGKVITLEFDSRNAELARANLERAGLGKKVEVKVGKALDLLPTLQHGDAAPFDLIFIDADKPPYLDYFKWAIRLGRPGTVIVADNVVRNGQVLDANSSDERVQGVRRLNAFLSTCTEVTATILQTVGAKEYDGMVVAVVK